MSSMREEQRFLQELQKLVRLGRTQGGVIEEGQLEEFFVSLSLKEEQKAQVRAYLGQTGIRVTQDLYEAGTSGDEAGASGEQKEMPLDDEALTPEGARYLREYEEMIRAMEIPPVNVLDAVKLSAMAGERQAQLRLIEYSLPKVLDIARLYLNQGVNTEELISAGNEALTIAVSLLAPLEGPEDVDEFLASRIMGAMEDLVADNLDRRSADLDIEDLVNRVAEKAAQLSEMLGGRKVTAEELAREGEVTAEEIEEAVRLTGGRIADLEGGRDD